MSKKFALGFSRKETREARKLIHAFQRQFFNEDEIGIGPKFFFFYFSSQNGKIRKTEDKNGREEMYINREVM